jgi:predicted ArsR family transcriptional regulator
MAEVTVNPDLDLEARLLFLDASVARTATQDERRRTADRLLRSARLLVRFLRRRDGDRAMAELLEDAAQRVARGRREPGEPGRLAYAVEALVEAVGAASHPR